MVTWALGRKSWMRKSFHTLGNHPPHPTSRVMGELQNLRGNCSDEFRDRWSEGKAEKIHQRDCCGTVLPSWEAAHVPAVSGGWGQWVGSGFRTQTSERGLGWLPWRYWGSGATQLRESREKHGHTREAKGHSQGCSLIPHAHRTQDPTLVNVEGG